MEQEVTEMLRSQPEVMTAKEVQAVLRCGLSTIYDMSDKGVLRTFRVGAGRGGVRFLKQSVVEFIQSASWPREKPARTAPKPERARGRPPKVSTPRLHVRPPQN